MKTAQDKLEEALIRDSVYMLRWSRQTYKRHAKLIDEAMADIAYKMAVRAPASGSLSEARYKAMLKYLRETSSVLHKGLYDLQVEDWKELAAYQSGFTAQAIAAAYPVEMVVTPPAAAAIHAAAMSRPFQGKVLKEWYRDLSYSSQRSLQQAVKLGYSEGETISQITSRLKSIMEIDKRHAETIARTATNHMANRAIHEAALQNEYLFKSEVWVSTLDGRTSLICISRDGKEYPLNSGPYPPAHPNCLTGDAYISTSGSISNVYKRRYKGALVDITTASGRTISITPNHPILTSRGWVASGEVNLGDEVACVTDADMLIGNKENRIDATFSALFSSIEISVDPSVITNTPSAAEHFHGDGVPDSDVKIINTKGLGRDAIIKIFRDDIENDWLPLAKFRKFAFNRFRSFLFFGKRSLSSSDGVMRGLCQIGDLLRSRCGHSCGLLLRPIPWLSSVLKKNLSYWGFAARKSYMPGNAFNADPIVEGFKNGCDFGVGEFDALNASGIDAVGGEDSFDWLFPNAENLPYLVESKSINGSELDYVVDVTIRENVFCHVYNLENDVNWYSANGIIAHNCRSVRAPKTKSWKELGFDDLGDDEPLNTRPFVADKRKVKDIPKNERDGIIGTTTAKNYGEFLKSQNRGFVEDVLGKERAKLFLDGGLSVDKFVDRKGTTITLDRLKEKHAIAFKEAWLNA